MRTKNDTAPTREHRGGKTQRFLQSIAYRLPMVLQCAGVALGMLALATAAALFGLLLAGMAGGAQ